VAHVRGAVKQSVGYLCASSDGVFASFVGDLVVHPSARGSGVGGALVDAVEARFPGDTPVRDRLPRWRGFLEHHGYTHPPRLLDVLTEFTTRAEGGAIRLQSASA
jgi:GNAT superfamily N-acetyltransferase